MLTELLYFTGIGLIIYAFYKWITLNDKYFEKRGIAHTKPVFLLGNTAALFLKQSSAPEFISKLYNQFPNEKIFGIFDFGKPLYYVRDPELIKQMAIKDFDHFEDHKSFLGKDTDTLFCNSLVLLTGDKWRDMRATLSPAFTGSKMRQMFGLVSECADDMSKFFLKQVETGETIKYDMKDLFSRYTNDVIASCAFGIKVNSMENSENEFITTGKRFLSFTGPKAAAKLLLLRFIPSVMKFLGIEFLDKDVATFFRSLVLDMMAVREEKNIFRPDMINILMNVRKGIKETQTEEKNNTTEEGFATVEESHIGKVTVKRQWTDDEIVAQCFLFFLAGLDTTSTLLSFTTYELALNQDVQQKLFEEVRKTDSALGGKQINYDSLQKLKYLDQVISETLRKWPPATFTDRICVEDYKWDDGDKIKLNIEKGLQIWIPISAIHLDPNYYPDPEKFSPERFSDENKSNILPGTYLPFGTGPRNCIGSRFALMEVKAIIYYLILNFNVEPNADTQIPLVLKKTPINIAPEKPIDLSFIPRPNSA